MVEVQVVRWRDIPAQVRGRQGRARAGQALSGRFQEAVDAAAMRAGLTGTDAYLAEWTSSPWEHRDQDLQVAVEALADELEAAYPADRLWALVEREGREA